MNYKRLEVMVTENIGSDSSRCFGGVGTTYPIRDGILCDKNKNYWMNCKNGYSSISDINEYFDSYNTLDVLKTHFKRVIRFRLIERKR